MPDELESLAGAAADVLVRAIASDGWDAAKSLYARLIQGREHQAKRTREALVRSEGAARAEATDREKASWGTRLRDAMDDDPALIEEIRRVLAAQSSAPAGAVSQNSSGAAGPVQQAAASGGSSITQVTASGGQSVRVNSPDQRHYKFSVPLVPLFLRKMVAEHTVVSVIALVAVGGATVGIATAARSSHANAPAVWSAFTTVATPPDTSLSVPTYAPSGTMVAALEGTPDGRTQAVAVNLAKNDAIEPIATSDDLQIGAIQEFSFDPSGGLLASVIGTGQGVALLNTSDWSTARTISTPVPGQNRYLTVEYVPTGAYVVISDGSDLFFYRTTDYQLVKTMPLHADRTSGAASFDISPDGTSVATGGPDDATVELWDIATGQETGTFTVSDGDTSVASLAFSPDGKYIAVLRYASPQDEVDVWSLQDKRVVATCLLQRRSVSGSPTVQFSPNGKTLMVDDGSTIQLFTAAGLRP